jgi:hypothetical protein
MVQDERRLVCYDPAVEPAQQRPLWSTEPFPGRICGQPVPAGAYLLVTDESGQVSVVAQADGLLAGTIPLGGGAIPAAAALKLGTGRILVPLADGTLLWQATSRPAGQVARAGP